ncbi:PREDICTED: uncharacterized protein LOC109342935 isoform X3 [Lupinus angustifolius]|uniref:uncharacterized protein LOC109342935 isoform X3 n=1 Tax=Lupinus angustifolius TaxID=3871 RepID=UPI00092F558F|nr:PREDICTED: uncharacterized protein LOC109342935 isoform X3 [Lupinus angustifolius]
MVAPSDVCCTEDTVKAFLEYLVDPMLPAKSTSRDNPTLSQQQSLAKQVHSVVLLYNYYHRKQHPELAFLKFGDFCKLAVNLRPPLLAYMKYMQKPDETELVDAEKQLSLTEKKIMDACDICMCLDASKNVPNIKGWPISKVAVLLIDSEKKNCVLLFSSITEGVWSVLEKDVDSPSQSSDVRSGTMVTYKKRRVVKKRTKDESNVDDSGFLQVGYSAVKEAAGIDKTDIMLLESCTVYSQSKETAASRFYIMKCSQLISQEDNQVPIRYLIESLQGPLVKKSSSSWIFTPVVEYFHVLPYSQIISDWISRETFSNSLQDPKLAEKNITADSPEVTESHVSSDEGMSVTLYNKPGSDDIESQNQKENNGSCTIIQSDSIEEAKDMNVDDPTLFPSQNIAECQDIAHTLQVSEDQEIETPYVQHYSNGSSALVKAEKDDSTRMLITVDEIKNQSYCNQNCVNTASEKAAVNECALIANHCNSDLQKLQTLLSSKRETLSQTALTALIGKRNELALQQRMIEDEIALCDKKIQRISAGRDDDLEIKIESIIEGCNDIWIRNGGRMCQHNEDQCSLPCFKRKRLTEAVLTVQSPCKELDAVCHENNWILPTYRVSHSDGKFQANVTIKGPDFEFSCWSNTCSHRVEARESGAAQILAKLRNMAKPDH